MTSKKHVMAAQAANKLGIGIAAIYDAIAKNELHAFRVGRTYRIAVTELDRWWQTKTTGTPAPAPGLAELKTARLALRQAGKNPFGLTFGELQDANRRMGPGGDLEGRNMDTVAAAYGVARPTLVKALRENHFLCRYAGCVRVPGPGQAFCDKHNPTPQNDPQRAVVACDGPEPADPANDTPKSSEGITEAPQAQPEPMPLDELIDTLSEPVKTGDGTGPGNARQEPGSIETNPEPVKLPEWIQCNVTGCHEQRAEYDTLCRFHRAQAGGFKDWDKPQPQDQWGVPKFTPQRAVVAQEGIGSADPAPYTTIRQNGIQTVIAKNPIITAGPMGVTVTPTEPMRELIDTVSLYVDAVTEYKTVLHTAALIPGTTIKATGYDVATAYDMMVGALAGVKQAMAAVKGDTSNGQ